MRKNLLRMLAVVVTVLTCISGNAKSLKVEANGLWYFVNTDTKKATLTNPNNSNGVADVYTQTSITVPSHFEYEGDTYEVTGISNSPLANSKVKKISLPATAVNLSSTSFYGATELESILIDKANIAFSSEDGVLYTKDMSNAVVIPSGKKGTYTIPAQTTNIAIVGEVSPTVLAMAPGIDRVAVASGNTTFVADKTLVYSKDKKTLVASVINGDTEVTIASETEFIRPYAFYMNISLRKVVLGPNVKTIGDEAFYYADKLAEVVFNNGLETIKSYAFAECSSLTEVKLPESLKMIGNGAFASSSVVSVSLPKSLKAESVGSSIFNNCKSLLNVEIPGLIEVIQMGMFSNCTALKKIVIPEGIRELQWNVFEGCSALEEVVLPKSLKSIGHDTFKGCVALHKFNIPETVESLGSDMFKGCLLTPLVLNKVYNSYSFLNGLDKNSVVVGPDMDNKKPIYDYFKGSYVTYNTAYYHTDVTSYLAGGSFKIVPNEYYTGEAPHGLEVKYGGTPLTPDSNGVYFVSDLSPNGSYSVDYSWYVGDKKICSEVVIETKKFSVDYTSSSTQTTFTINAVTVTTDKTYPVKRYGVIVNGKEYDYEGKPIKFEDLEPSTEMRITPFADLGWDYLYTGEAKTVWTNSLNIRGVISNAGPTSAVITVSYAKGDAVVEEFGLEDHGAGSVFVVNGLNPESTNTFRVYAKIAGGRKYYNDVIVKTSALELNMLKPKCVSSSCAIVAAETNMTDDEVNAGFQWKKYDAPASLDPNEGNAVVFDGKLEGYIKNLQSTSYYNVRAFYRSASGRMITSEWVTFDPSDFSFFEPTVHTYPVLEVTTNTAYLKGYALAGTDQIEEQGFQYWVSGGRKSVRRAGETPDNVQTVVATGQVMRVELTNLLPGTTYKYRAYVKTASGMTYGEEMEFETEQDYSGVDSIYGDEEGSYREVIGFFDINGIRYDVAQKGFNIVVFSDGTSRKIFVK